MNPKSDDLSGMKILLVDDVPLNIEVLFQTLKLKNYQISMANSGVKAGPCGDAFEIEKDPER